MQRAHDPAYKQGKAKDKKTLSAIVGLALISSYVVTCQMHLLAYKATSSGAHSTPASKSGVK